MKPVHTVNSNLVYKGPPGVLDLHCQRVGRVIRSVWTLSDDERAAVAQGANIALDIFSEPIPATNLSVIDEPGIGEDDPAVMRRLDELRMRGVTPG